MENEIAATANSFRFYFDKKSTAELKKCNPHYIIVTTTLELEGSASDEECGKQVVRFNVFAECYNDNKQLMLRVAGCPTPPCVEPRL